MYNMKTPRRILDSERSRNQIKSHKEWRESLALCYFWRSNHGVWSIMGCGHIERKGLDASRYARTPVSKNLPSEPRYIEITKERVFSLKGRKNLLLHSYDPTELAQYSPIWHGSLSHSSTSARKIRNTTLMNSPSQRTALSSPSNQNGGEASRCHSWLEYWVNSLHGILDEHEPSRNQRQGSEFLYGFNGFQFGGLPFPFWLIVLLSRKSHGSNP